MKRNILILLFTVCLSAACDDTRMDNMAPDKVYIPKYGLSHEIGYDLGSKVDVPVWANKSGINGTDAHVTFAIDEATLTAYNAENNTSYSLLPQECYTLAATAFDLTGEEQYARFTVSYDPAAIKDLCGYDAETYALPLKVSASGVDVNDGMSSAIIAFTVKKPVIGFSSTEDRIVAVDPAQEGNVVTGIGVGIGFESITEFTAKVTVDETLVSAYNAANNTDYTLLPSAHYTLDGEVAFAVGDNNRELSLEVKKEMPFGEFLLPLRLSDPSRYSIEEGKDICYVVVRKMPDMLGITTDQLTYNNLGDGSMANLLDDNLTTIYNSEFGTLYSTPAWIQVDLGKTYSTTMFKYTNRSTGNAATIPTKITIQISNNGTDFTDYQVVSGLPVTLSSEYTSPFITPVDGCRYIRLHVTAVNGGGGFSMAEIRFYGAE